MVHVILCGNTRLAHAHCWLSNRTWTSDQPVYAFPRWMGVFQILLVYWTQKRPRALLVWSAWWGVLLAVGLCVDLFLLSYLAYVT